MPGTFVIDQQQTFAGPPIALTTAPKLEFGTAAQAVTRDGERRWVVQVACTYAAEPGMKVQAEVIEVTVNGEDPSLTIAPGTPVEFNQLRVGVSAPEKRDNGRVVGGKPWYSAAGVRPVAAKSAAAA
jgi:hypothetical protein